MYAVGALAYLAGVQFYVSRAPTYFLIVYEKSFFRFFASDASEKYEKGNDSRHLRFGGKFGGNGGKCPK